MKTETQIAGREIAAHETFGNYTTKIACNNHKATCQRFLEFLEKGLYPQLLFEENTNGKDLIKNKITDLKQAIKLYEDAGI